MKQTPSTTNCYILQFSQGWHCTSFKKILLLNRVFQLSKCLLHRDAIFSCLRWTLESGVWSRKYEKPILCNIPLQSIPVFFSLSNMRWCTSKCWLEKKANWESHLTLWLQLPFKTNFAHQNLSSFHLQHVYKVRHVSKYIYQTTQQK